MKLRSVLFIVLTVVVVFLAACGNADTVKRKYLEAGNRYFDSGKYPEAQIMYQRAIKKDARFGEAYYRLALTELRLGRLSNAVRNLRRAIELQPENRDAPTKLVDLYMTYYLLPQAGLRQQKARIREEIDDLVKLLKERDKDSFDAKRIEGYLAFSDGNLEKAAELLESAAKVHPERRDITLARVQALFGLNRNEEAERLGLQVLEQHKDFGPAYDVLFRYYMLSRRAGDAEKILQRKADAIRNDPTPLLQLGRFYFLMNRRVDMNKTIEKILRDRKTFPDGYLIAGDFYARLREFDTAMNYYREGAEAGGEKASTYRTRMVEALVAQNRVGEAASMLDDLLRKEPKNDTAIQMRASLRLQSGRPEEARRAIDELLPVINRQPKNPVLRFNVGRGYMALNELDPAVVQFREALKLKEDFVPPRIALAQIYLVKRHFGEAITEAAEALKYEPENSVAKLIRASALMGSGMLEQARAEVEQALRSNPGSAEANFQLGMLNLAEKKLPEAEATFRRMLQIVPGDSRAVYGLAEVSFARGDSSGAVRILEEHVKKFPERADLRLALANSLLRASRFQEAAEQYKSLLAKQPQSVELHLRLGETYRRSGNLRASVEHFEQARKLAPKNAMALRFLAIAYDTGGRKSEARPLYEQILQLEPDDPVSLNNLAYILAEEGKDLDRALTLAQRAKQRLPTDPNVSDTLGLIYLKKNLPESAVPIFQDLVRRDPERSTFSYHLGLALHQKGDYANARKQLEAALRKNPSKEEEQRIKEIIAKMG